MLSWFVAAVSEYTDAKPLWALPTVFLFIALSVTIYVYGLAKVSSKTTRVSKSLIEDSQEPKAADYDIIIVGAGVCGAALGAALGKKLEDCRVLMIEEHWKEPNRIVGELLQPGGAHQLKRLDLPEALEGLDAQPVNGYAIFLEGRSFAVPYPNHTNGFGFHNGRFVMKLRQLAKENPRLTTEQGKVTNLLSRDGRVTGVQYQTQDGIAVARAPLTVVASGCLSNLREPLIDNTFVLRSRFLGIVLRDVDFPFESKGHVILSNPSPILLYPISSNEARMLIDFPDTIPDISSGALKSYLLKNILPQLPLEVQPSFKAAINQDEGENKIKFMSMPNRTLNADPLTIPGVVLLGDSLNMRHPLTGGGMTVGLTDVYHLVSGLQSIKNLDNIEELNECVKIFYKKRRGDAASINILADALYDVFCQKSDDLRVACFEYLQKGPRYFMGPISLLSGLVRKQELLIIHFFAVCIYGCVRELLPFPSPYRLLKSLRIFRRALEIILPLLKQENKFHPILGLPITLFCNIFSFLFWV